MDCRCLRRWVGGGGVTGGGRSASGRPGPGGVSLAKVRFERSPGFCGLFEPAAAIIRAKAGVGDDSEGDPQDAFVRDRFTTAGGVRHGILDLPNERFEWVGGVVWARHAGIVRSQLLGADLPSAIGVERMTDFVITELGVTGNTLKSVGRQKSPPARPRDHLS